MLHLPQLGRKIHVIVGVVQKMTRTTRVDPCVCFFLFKTGPATPGRAGRGRESTASAARARGRSVSGTRHSADGGGCYGGDVLQPHTGIDFL